MNKIKIIEQIEKALVITTVFLYPLFFLTLFNNYFETPKLLLLTISVTILMVIKILKLMFKNSFELNTSNFDLFSVLLGLAYFVSTIFTKVNRIDAFFLPGTTSFVLLSVLFFLSLNQFTKETKKVILTTIVTSGFILSILQILSSFGIIKLIPNLPEIIKSPLFTPFGNIFGSLVFLISLIPFLAFNIFKKNDIAEKILSSLVILVFLINIVSSTVLFIKNKETTLGFLEPKYGWNIAIDTLKNSPFFGVGPSNFAYSFNKLRPLIFNSEKDWSLKYLQSSSFVMTMITETGILGIAVFGFLIYLIVKNRNFKDPIYVSIVIYLISMLVLPISAISVFTFFVLLATAVETKSTKLGYFMSKIPQLLIVIPAFGILLATSYLSFKSFYSEFLFTRSIISLNKNEPQKSYELINKAISVNQYVDRYHLFAANLNIAIAESMAKKEKLSDEDRNNISQLIQQSIREGKAAIAVSQYKSSNWENLSNVYVKIISFAKGSDKFAAESLKQAIALDPINPILRIKLGSLYYSLKEYDLAIEAFKLAVIAKPDLANSHYNLALAYKEAKQIDKAKEEINTTLKLLGKESTNYEKAMKELQSIEELSKPQEQSTSIEPKIELPADASQQTTTDQTLQN